MLKDIKNKIKKYGFISIELVILASIMLTAGGYGISKFAQNATGTTKVFDDAYYDALEADKSELTIKIIGRNHINYLYDVGEKNLSDDDTVQINGVDCYVLKVEDDKALLITKDMYNVRFDDANYNKGNKTNVGTGSHANLTYDYSQSYLRKWMYDFYTNELGKDDRIIKDHEVNYYTYSSYTTDLSLFKKETITTDPVFALDAKEAKQYASKFGWTHNLNYNYGFWTTAGFRDRGSSGAWYVSYYGRFSNNNVVGSAYGARPAFWISLN